MASNAVEPFKKIFMSTPAYAALIEFATFSQTFAETAAALPKNLTVKKAFVFHQNTRNALSKRFPNLEWVEQYEDILNDGTIGHVLISAPVDRHRNLIGAALKANKQVQIV
jgi:predicted dehydrogenase